MDLQQNSNYSLSTRRSLTAKTMSALNCENCNKAHSKPRLKKTGRDVTEGGLKCGGEGGRVTHLLSH